MSEPMDEVSVDNRANVQNSAQKPANVLRVGTMAMSSITIQDYETNFWPKLEHAILHLLTSKPSEYTPISYEQMYTCVYKCVCKQFSERLFSDLINVITRHLENISSQLQQQTHDAATYINRVHEAVDQYLHALQAIVPVFAYMNRFYVDPKLKTDLGVELRKLFTVIVTDRHMTTLIPVLDEANLRPFTVLPQVMATIVKNLYILKPEYVDLRPQLFAKYIPNILPACTLNQLDQYVQEAQQMQRDLLTHPDFISGDQSRKRRSEEDTPNIVSSSSRPTDYSSVS